MLYVLCMFAKTVLFFHFLISSHLSRSHILTDGTGGSYVANESVETKLSTVVDVADVAIFE